MSKRPALASELYKKYVNDKGNVTWPEDRQERTHLAQVLYGKQLISEFDYWLNYALDFIENSETTKPFLRKNDAYKKDKYFRNGFSTLSPEQKNVVWSLVRTITQGILFSSLVNIDRGDYGEYTVVLKPKGNEGAIRIAPERYDDLHDELNDWILSFSKFADEIVEFVEIRGGWELRLKAFYNV